MANCVVSKIEITGPVEDLKKIDHDKL